MKTALQITQKLKVHKLGNRLERDFQMKHMIMRRGEKKKKRMTARDDAAASLCDRTQPCRAEPVVEEQQMKTTFF